MTKNQLLKAQKYWKEGAEYGFTSAEDIIKKAGRYSSGMFFLHLAVEKMIESHFCKKVWTKSSLYS